MQTAIASCASSNPNALLDPAKIAAAKAKLSPQLAAPFDQAMHAVRQALVLTLHDLFLIAMALSAIALVATPFMPDIPLPARQARRPAASREAPDSAEAAEPNVAVG